MEPHLIANASALQDLPKGISATTPIEEFYVAEAFAETRLNLVSPHGFRDGFWLKTIERFFVLEQFAKVSKSESVFHAELDQLLFRTDLLLNNLEQLHSQGIRVPFHSSKRALASIMHIQGTSGLSHLLDFSRTTNPFANEMELLARWGLENPEKINALPTLASVANPNSTAKIAPVKTLNLSETQGLVDAAQLGQWIGGIDPRNIPISEVPKNHFVDHPLETLLSRSQLSAATFKLDENSGILEVEIPGSQKWPLYNLHLHSKAHTWITARPRNLRLLFDRANMLSDSRIPGARRTQVIGKIMSAFQIAFKSPDRLVPFLRRSINRCIRRRPSSAPFLSGDTFRSFADYVWDSQSLFLNPTRVKEGDVIFLESDLLQDFSQKVLVKLRYGVTLIIGNSDINHGRSLEEIAKHPMVNRVFAQNLTVELSGVEVLPIGLENRWIANNGNISHFRNKSRSQTERIFRIMWCFSIHTNPEARVTASTALLKSISADKLENLGSRQHQMALRRYGFVASPPGNGLDTHRTWEAMYQGCVPILLKSHVADSYWKLGLPVWVVDSYQDLTLISESQLKEKYSQLRPRFNHKALWFDFWKQRIQGASS